MEIKTYNDSVMTVFEQCYKLCCKKKNVTPLKNLIFKNKSHILDFCVDRINYSQWEPILVALSGDLSLQCLAVRCRVLVKNVLEDIDCDRLVRTVTNSPVILTRFMLSNLIYAVAQCLSQSNVLSVLQFEGLPLQLPYFSPIADALRINESLMHVSFQGCLIGDKGCDLVCQALRYRNSIVTINMAECNISEVGAFSVAELIKYQKIYRYSENWKHTLRYRLPDLEGMPGLRRVTLSGNLSLGDNGFLHLVEVLLDDLWIKAVDLECCGLSENSAQSCKKLFEYNTSLHVLDLRNNPLISSKSLQNISTCLKKNENIFPLKSPWLTNSNHSFVIQANKYLKTNKSKTKLFTCKSQTKTPSILIPKFENLQEKLPSEINQINILKNQLKQEISLREKLEELNHRLFDQVKELKKQQTRNWRTDISHESDSKICANNAHCLTHKSFSTMEKVSCVPKEEIKENHKSQEINPIFRIETINDNLLSNNSSSHGHGDVGVKELHKKICTGAEILEKMLMTRRLKSLNLQNSLRKEGSFLTDSSESLIASPEEYKMDNRDLFESTSEDKLSDDNMQN